MLLVAVMALGKLVCGVWNALSQRSRSGEFWHPCRCLAGVPLLSPLLGVSAYWVAGMVGVPSAPWSASTPPLASGSRCHPWQRRGSSVGQLHVVVEDGLDIFHTPRHIVQVIRSFVQVIRFSWPQKRWTARVAPLLSCAVLCACSWSDARLYTPTGRACGL